MGVVSDSEPDAQKQEENLIAILVLVVLLIFFLVYCCWGTSYCQNLRFCRRDDPDALQNRRIDVDQTPSNPTIILLPHGRILVVDGTVLARFHSENNGLDLFDLGDRVFRDHETRSPSFIELDPPSITEVDTETNIKDCISPSGSPLPPAYDSLFGNNTTSPPPYSEAFAERIRNVDSEENDESSL